jgi:hypothetical protein
MSSNMDVLQASFHREVYVRFCGGNKGGLMRRLVLALGIVGLMLVACDPAVSQSAAGQSRAPEEPVKFPSMVELLARPVEYEGALIEVTGFYGGVYPALFLTRDHAEINDLDSAFLVTNETEGYLDKHCVGYYVTIEGRFKRRLGGLPGPDPENFEIDDVTQVRIFKDGDEIICWPPEKSQQGG